MASSFHFLHKPRLLHIFLILTILTPYAISCYTSIFGFGDSLTDTGNTLYLPPPGEAPDCVLPPYGETYFHNTTGRCCDGRLIIDFIALNLGLPFVPPYFGVRNSSGAVNLEKGVNFAVIGAPTLDDSFFEERGIPNAYKHVSLRCQLNWFKDLLPSLCSTPSNCKKLLQSSLLVMNFGGNDYIRTLVTAGRSVEEARSYVPLVVNTISSAINELIELEVGTIMVQGSLPFGCLSYYLAYFRSSDKEEYDSWGCLIWLNKFAEYHNELLQIKLNHIRELHPHATILYGDLYNAALPFFLSPRKFGFTKGALIACCGTGGPLYNINPSDSCGYPPTFAFDHPSLYVNWDGFHLTEATYRLITKGLLEGRYTIPPINTSCVSTVVSAEYSTLTT
ncbi:hypothetical protein F0562_013869 [Nyssa sinensis]|uniref:Uncharacterized protein n=1 Tax=Nyssa sinensis TaxID=561372 RepID=A0A5J4ZPL8_9ASTE|nr:hypothetical protein F0562_013869 [Nyssa sinensis]